MMHVVECAASGVLIVMPSEAVIWRNETSAQPRAAEAAALPENGVKDKPKSGFLGFGVKRPS